MLETSSLILAGFLSILLYIVVISRTNKFKTLNHQHGCEHPVTYPHIDPFFGLDLKLQEIWQSLKYQGIPFMSNLHIKYGKTIWLNNLGTSDIRTIDSENLQNAWSTNNCDWGYQPYRLPVMGPFCGRGFITTDNEEWQKARVLLRPTFSKANISNLSPFIALTKAFFQGIPQDGHTTVDLQAPLASLVGTNDENLCGNGKILTMVSVRWHFHEVCSRCYSQTRHRWKIGPGGCFSESLPKIFHWYGTLIHAGSLAVPHTKVNEIRGV